ncbi:MAG TPA: hypothetical protein VNT29_09000, partial [Candidatus Limnocylindrales bacterium]|nr:hypothetical protein [Candidatus Limnocylindrales bacterium]
MTTIRNMLRASLEAALIALAIIVGGVAPAVAQLQQGLSNPPPSSRPPSSAPQLVIPQRQGKETSTLELPSMPAKQGSDPLKLPPQVPQGSQELVLPTRELRQQPGYEQVTVTV